MNSEEQLVIQYMNIARMYPLWYAYFYLKNPKTEKEISLKETLLKMKSATKVLECDKVLFDDAYCHANSTSALGLVTHERQSPRCLKHFGGECIQYGNHNAAEIVLDLLIDEGVENLGHRKIILDTDYEKVGVSLFSHKKYGIQTVIDFK